MLLFADRAKPFYLFVARAVILCLGGIGGAVYHRMSLETAKGEPTALCLGVGNAAEHAPVQYDAGTAELHLPDCIRISVPFWRDKIPDGVPI